MSAKADYNIAKKNFEYATITSPVSGTVISKEIEQGQTVAASFETPTLFEVAEDLSKMQIEASVSEADIGYIKPDMPVLLLLTLIRTTLLPAQSVRFVCRRPKTKTSLCTP